MSALAKIKKTAAQHEQDRQYDKALAQYARLLDGEAGLDEEVDVTLYNRAGDLALRAGDVPRAVTYFERAIDVYAAGGFLNNAVALAVKILRHAPGHLAAHHTLGVLYARKGFRAEARQHLAEYAAHMHRAGRADEVRRALSELAALGASADEAAVARELLTTRAATPDDAGALVKGFDAALGPASHAGSALDRSALANVPLSELIELEVRGGPRAASDAGVRAPRWATALPGDPAPLRISVLRARAEAHQADAGDRAVSERDETRRAAPSSFEMLDLSTFEPSAAGAFEPELLDLGTSELSAFTLDLGTLDLAAAEAPRAREILADPTSVHEIIESRDTVDLSSHDVAGFEVATFNAAPTTAQAIEITAFELPPVERSAVEFSVHEPVAPTSLDWDAAELRQFEQVHDELAAALPTLDAPRADAPHPAPSVSPADATVGSDQSTDLGDWLRSTEPPVSTRLVTPAPRESGDEAADFDAALRAFTSGIAQSVDAGDRESHYDLGVAFREMGLFSEAVREFQRALAAPGGGLREREALAQCFLDLGRAELALATLELAAAAAVAAGASGETLVGVHYVLAEAARAVGRVDDARAWYVRVLATDYGFRDAAAHLAALPPPRTPVASR